MSARRYSFKARIIREKASLWRFQMIKTILVVLAFVAGAVAVGAPLTISPSEMQCNTVTANAPLTISPSEMQRNMKPDDRPVHYMKGDFN